MIADSSRPLSQGGEAMDWIRRVDGLLRQRRAAEAAVQCEGLLAMYPARAEGPMLMARARQMLGDFTGMLEAARDARRLDRAGRLAMFLEVEALLHVGEVAEARGHLDTIEAAAGDDAMTWRRLCEFHTHLGQHVAAERAARRLVSLRPDDVDARYALASALIAVGRLEEAEALLDDLVRRAPADGDAYYNRATLRRQTPERNHVEQLQQALSAAGDSAARIPLHFALAKELEDLGHYEASFEHVATGAAQRRRMLSYRIENDERTIGQDHADPSTLSGHGVP